LSNITSVGDYVNISNNTSLTNIGGLSCLNAFDGSLIIDYNNGLTNLGGLTSLLGTYYIVRNNPFSF
jgi:hypothetical protein